MRLQRPGTPEERRASARNVAFLVLVALVIALVVAAIVVFSTFLSRFGG
jgi:hypothetical protein